MKNEKIVINIMGSVNVEERKKSVIVFIWFTNLKENIEVYIGKKILCKTIGSKLYTSKEMRDHEYCDPYFEKRKRE